jgi:hypothetical protein
MMFQKQVFDSVPVNDDINSPINLVERMCPVKLKREKSVRVSLLSIRLQSIYPPREMQCTIP